MRRPARRSPGSDSLETARKYLEQGKYAGVKESAQKAYDAVRSVSPRLDSDRSLAPDIAAVSRLISAASFGKLLE